MLPGSLLHLRMADKPYLLRGVRGAITVDADEAGLVQEATRELLTAVIEENRIDPAFVASIIFTTSPDLTSTFPAGAARDLGLTDVPLMCMSEIDVPGGLPRTVRLLLHLNTRKSQTEIRHVFLRGAVVLRPDLVPESSAA